MKKAEVVKDLVYEEMLNKRLRHDYERAKKFKAEAEVAIGRQKVAILNLHKKGMPIAEIASVFGITEEEVSKIIS